MQSFLNFLWKTVETIARFFFELLFKLLHKEYTDEINEGLMQFIKFGIVGVSNTVISYILYTVSLLILKKTGLFPGTDYIIAQIIQFVLSVLWSFYWNNKMVFVTKEGQTRNLLKSLIKTYISYSFTGLFLSSVLLVFWVKILHISEFIAPLLNLIVTIPVNFLINKFWAFKTTPESMHQEQ